MQNGIWAPGMKNMIIVTEKGDTLCSGSKDPRRYGAFREKHTGQYFITYNRLRTIYFRCNAENGVLVGDYYYYDHHGEDPTRVIQQGYFTNGRWAGYKIWYHYSNGMVREINVYNPCNHERGGIWMYFDDSGELLKTEDYGAIPDTCHIPNQYLFDSLSEKYRYHYDTLRIKH